MATKTAGTKTTSSLTAIQWYPQGMSAADLATINEAIRVPVTGAWGAAAAIGNYIENGVLYLPPRGNTTLRRDSIQLQAGDWICVDGAGWVIVVPNSIFSTSWQHS